MTTKQMLPLLTRKKKADRMKFDNFFADQGRSKQQNEMYVVVLRASSARSNEEMQIECKLKGFDANN